MKKFFLLFSICFFSLNCFAEGIPQEWQLHFQKAGSPVMEKLEHFHDLLLVIIFVISGFVLGLLAYVCIKFNKKSHPNPSQTAHNTLLEIIWTIVPVFILIIIAIPSFKLLHFMEKEPQTDMTIKVVGYQWYWNYQYPDNGNFNFDSYIIQDKDLQPGQLRLLEVDNRLILPVGKNIRVLITSNDVIHSWSVPSLGIKTDAIPGRTNETWLRINEPGLYYGQCSEICGVGHGFMPIAIQAIPEEDFAEWTKTAQKQFS